MGAAHLGYDAVSKGNGKGGCVVVQKAGWPVACCRAGGTLLPGTLLPRTQRAAEPMETLLLLTLLLPTALVWASSVCSSDYTFGDSSCPCRDSVDLSDFLNSEGTALRPVINNHLLPTHYGLSCGQHDASGSYCSGSDAAWCKETWCWVDPHNCSGTTARNSTWFPGYAHYSYDTCGSEDSFSDSGTFDSMPYRVPQTTNLAPPLRKVTSCVDLASPSDPCGPLVKGRVQFNNDWCALEQQVESSQS